MKLKNSFCGGQDFSFSNFREFLQASSSMILQGLNQDGLFHFKCFIYLEKIDKYPVSRAGQNSILFGFDAGSTG